MTDMTQGLSPRSIRLLHTSDLHLASPASAGSLRSIVHKANELAVDLVLLPGDLFDNSRVGQETLEQALEALSHLEIPLVLLPGNHDCLDNESVYHRLELSRWAPKVHLITATDGQQVSFPDLDLGIWGRAMEEHAPHFHPLEGAPTRDGFRWQLGMAHGFHYPDGDQGDRSSPILSHEIASTGYDYIALGHVHVYRDVSAGPVTAYYSGAPEPSIYPRQKPAEATLVHLDPASGVTLDRVSLPDIVRHHHSQ